MSQRSGRRREGHRGAQPQRAQRARQARRACRSTSWMMGEGACSSSLTCGAEGAPGQQLAEAWACWPGTQAAQARCSPQQGSDRQRCSPTPTPCLPHQRKHVLVADVLRACREAGGREAEGVGVACHATGVGRSEGSAAAMGWLASGCTALRRSAHLLAVGHDLEALEHLVELQGGRPGLGRKVWGESSVVEHQHEQGALQQRAPATSQGRARQPAAAVPAPAAGQSPSAPAWRPAPCARWTCPAPAAGEGGRERVRRARCGSRGGERAAATSRPCSQPPVTSHPPSSAPGPRCSRARGRWSRAG